MSHISGKTIRNTMRFCRRLFRNTPIQRLRITTFEYKKLAQQDFGQDPIKVPFRGAHILCPGGDYTTLPTFVDGVCEKVELDEFTSYLDNKTAPVCAVDIGANVGSRYLDSLFMKSPKCLLRICL